MDNNNYYEPRFISKTNNNSLDLFFEEKNNVKTLKEYIFEYDKIVLLGNPGIGKTKELESLFDTLWDEKETTSLMPFSINLKNFRPINEFEDLISYKDWKNLSSIIFILDGLDEISEIQDFISAFEIFISKNKTLNIKYVISCRTNIYEKYLVNISNFETFFLDNLTRYQAKSILEKKFKINIDILPVEQNHLNYLQTPFFLNLFADYYLSNQKLPQSDTEMWELYVEKVIEEHKKKQKKVQLVNKPKLIKQLKKVAFVNELMQKNFSTEDELDKILGENHLEFIDNPFFVELKTDSKKYNFDHRQIQEYFVAKSLSEKSFEEILSIIKINDIDSIHPSLFNTITFLINLLDKESDKYKSLIDWIEDFQIELLFRADSDRINEKLKAQVFQYYFQNECIKKTFWITTNRTFSVKEIAKFGDCESNFDYLTTLIKDKGNHFRTHISALDLLSFFTIPLNKKAQIKKDFLNLLKDSTISESIKSHIIECINAQDLSKDDKIYLDQIFDIFKKETNKELNRALLSLINDYEDIDSYFWYIRDEFLRENNIEKRKDSDEVLRGNSWVLEAIIMRLNNSNNFIEIVKYHFMDEININTDNKFAEQILNRSLFFDRFEDDFIIRFLIAFNRKTSYYINDVLLRSIILKSKPISQIKAFEYLIENNSFSKVSYFLATIANSDNIKIVIKKYKNEVIIDDIEVFRNVIANNGNRELAGEFNNTMIENGFAFKDVFLFEKEFQEERAKFENKIQQNFDILFNKDSLLEEIENIFKLNLDPINSKSMSDIDMDWYRKNGHGNTIDTSYSFLHTLIYDNRTPMIFQDVERILEDDFIIIKKIKLLIERNETSSNKFIISKEQKTIIYEWFKKTSESIKFDEIMEFISINQFSILSDYEKLKHILFFQDKFDFKLSNVFLLNSIEFFDIEKSNDENHNFEKLLARINNKELFDKRIIDNLINKKLFSLSLSNHIQYALDNNLREAFPKIRECFLMEGFDYNLNKKLERYVELTSDVNLLKECCLDVKSHKLWYAINILISIEKEQDFCLKKAIEYLESEEVNKYYVSDALAILFQLNSIEAVKCFYSFLINDSISSIKENSFSNYDAIEEYGILEKLFNEIYLKDGDRTRYSNSSSFLNAYISNLSKKEESYNKIQEALKSIKDALEIAKSDSGLFYINLLIDNSNNSYINSKSKALSFNEALGKVEQIIN